MGYRSQDTHQIDPSINPFGLQFLRRSFVTTNVFVVRQDIPTIELRDNRAGIASGVFLSDAAH